jgi:trk system potassium uptake protein TrkH
VRIAGQVIPDRVAQSVLAFIFLYFQTIVILSFALMLTGMPFADSMACIVASVNNLGPALGPTGPAGNYAVLTDLQTWICTLAMLLGRLEIFSILVLLTPTFWRK